MFYLIRKSRHCGLSLALDSARYYSIDIDIRSLSDYLILKAQGLQGLTKDLKWLYSYIDTHLVRKLGSQHVILLTRRGGIAHGVFPFPPLHKKEREDILKAVDVKVEYGERLDSMLKGTYKTVGDVEHSRIIMLYIEEALNMGAIAEKLERSSRTIQTQLKREMKEGKNYRFSYIRLNIKT